MDEQLQPARRVVPGRGRGQGQSGRGDHPGVRPPLQSAEQPGEQFLLRAEGDHPAAAVRGRSGQDKIAHLAVHRHEQLLLQLERQGLGDAARILERQSEVAHAQARQGQTQHGHGLRPAELRPHLADRRGHPGRVGVRGEFQPAAAGQLQAAALAGERHAAHPGFTDIDTQRVSCHKGLRDMEPPFIRWSRRGGAASGCRAAAGWPRRCG